MEGDRAQDEMSWGSALKGADSEGGAQRSVSDRRRFCDTRFRSPPGNRRGFFSHRLAVCRITSAARRIAHLTGGGKGAPPWSTAVCRA
jgi:hypothetical protein